MRFVVALASSMVLFTAPAIAQSPANPAEGGVVHRLSVEEVDAIMDRKVQKRVVEEEFRVAREEIAVDSSPRLNKTGRIVTGALGFLGHAAADTAYANKCGLFGLVCYGLSSNTGPLLDVVR